MNRCSAVRFRSILFSLPVAFAAPAAWGPRAFAAAEPTPVASLASLQDWRDGIELIRRGRFEAATAKIAPLAEVDPTAGRLSQWLDQLNEQSQMRAELTLADYEKYVGWARKYHDQGDLNKALNYAVLALNNAVSKAAFRKEPWVEQLIRDAMAEAAGLRTKREWLDALSLYYQVGEILDRDAEVRKLKRECRTHARLDAVYAEDSNWQERLVLIEPRMVEEAMREIDHKYVEEADFRRMTETGLEQMLYLSESASLRELFVSLQDDLERGAFEARIRARLAKVRNLPVVDFKVAREEFLNALRINRQTVQIPRELVVHEYMTGCLEELDEFTSMIWPVQMPEFEKHTRGDFVGVGIQIRKHYNPDLKDDEIVVVSPIEDSPAYEAGIQTGDVITQVNGESILGITLNKAVETITGPMDTTVTLSLRRDSEPEELTFVLRRRTIKIHSIKGFARDPVDDQKWQYMLDPDFGIGYVRVVSFQDNTVEDLERTIDRLSQQGLRGLILDLRFNPGGLLKSAVQFSELFLDRKATIVSTRGLHSPEWPIHTQQQGPYRELPLVVLVNESSASASEIVAGAIRDHNRGLIVGERTYGKFSVQNLIQLARTDAHLKLTTAFYYLPNGDSLHKDEDSVEWGVAPDVSIPLVAKELVKIVQGFRKRDIIGQHAQVLAQKVLSDEEADLRAEVERARESIRGADGAETGPESGAAAEPGAADASVDPAGGGDRVEGEVEAGANEEAEEEVDRNDRPDIDPQLDAALLVMRAQLIDRSSQMVARRSEPAEGVSTR